MVRKGDISSGRLKKKDLEMRDKLKAAGWDTDTASAVKDVYNGNIFLDGTRGIVQLPEAIELILDAFEQVMDGGPLAREPCFGVKVMLVDAKLHEDAIHRGPAQVYPGVREGIKSAMMQGGPILFEPVQTHSIEGPIESTGDMTKLVMNKRGQVLEMTQERNLSIIKAKIPVAEMLGWSSDLRSATSGRGTSALMDQKFERCPPELQRKYIEQIIKRKGLTAGMLGA
jgi:elongation factor 2